tara:strand:+ start:6553 stop:7101 length:549 start_codon:yes stop_codon:yes gene_type:complete
MTSLLLLAALCTTPLEDGTLIFIEHGRRIVELGTDATITHVAIVATDEKGVTWIYEATPPKVRRVTLSTYYKEIVELNKERTEENKQHMRMWVMRPNVRYAASKVKKLKLYLDSQLGKRYSILSYITRRPGVGCHCGEFVSHALKRVGIELEHPCKESPQTVIEKVVKYYQRPIEVCLSTAA